MTTPILSTIQGVEIKNLKTHGDARGFFREVIRFTDPFFKKLPDPYLDSPSVHSQTSFAQWSHSKMSQNVVKAWHYHHVQYDWWYLPIGQVIAALYDNREESLTYRELMVFKMGESSYGEDTHEICVRIPPGVLHGCRVLSDVAHLFYITSETYDPSEEGRIPFDSSLVPHNWGSGAIVADNDMREFEPIRPRVRV